MTSLPTTEFGLPFDKRFAEPASPEQIARAADALANKGGFVVEVVDTVADARSTVNRLLKEGARVFTALSETLRVSGLEADIAESGRFEPLRPKLLALRASGHIAEMRALGQAPEVVVGSAHAVTEDGRVLIASASGSQIGPTCYGASRAILVVGAQKVVPDLTTALARIETYAYPLEDARVRRASGRPSTLGKILIFNHEWFPNRTTIVLVREPIGF